MSKVSKSPKPVKYVQLRSLRAAYKSAKQFTVQRTKIVNGFPTITYTTFTTGFVVLPKNIAVFNKFVKDQVECIKIQGLSYYALPDIELTKQLL